MSTDFKLSATLRAHEEDVRALVFPTKETIFSASRDNTIRKWSLTTQSPPIFDDTIALQASHWLNALAYLAPTSQYPNGLIAGGGRETFVFVKEVGRPVEQDPYRMLIGHAGNITCLAFSVDGTKIISGGWDSQVFLWDIEKGSVITDFPGHQDPVWGVLAYDKKFVLTACADKKIRLFDFNGKCHRVIEGHTDVVRCFAKLPPGHSSGADFASAGNDEVIRLWTLDGQSLGSLEGHTAYIYSLASLPNGDIVSSSEDRTVRIWRDGQCIQTITHPAISLWSVTVCPETGDIASGASDNIIRVFSRASERQASQEAIETFESSNRMYAIPAETASQGQPFQKENLPGPDALQTQIGHRDGQQLFIREHDNSVTAHLWSSSTSQWNLIGTVVSGEGSGTNKKSYNGKEYDYVFDIDIEDGKPPLKLPYNSTDSPWDAARLFLERNELPMTYYEQVANWISDNTKGTRIGQESAAAPAPQQAPDPWGSDRRYRPGDAGSTSTSQTRKLPQRTYITILEGNASKGVQILADSSTQLQTAGKIEADGALTSEDVAALQKMADQLTNNPQDPHPLQGQVEPLLRIAQKWPQKSRVPAVALLARLAVSPSFVQATSAGEGTVVDAIISAGLLQPRQETANNVVHALRLLVNLCVTDAGRLIAAGKIDQILGVTNSFAGEPESAAQTKALATLYLNLSVLLTSGASAKESQGREQHAEKLLIAIATLLEIEGSNAADSDALFRALCGLGTILTLGSEFRARFKGEIGGTLHMASKKSAAQTREVQELVQEIRDEAR